MDYTIIHNCRLCKGKLGYEIPFGKTPLANSYPKTKDEIEKTYSLTLVKCDDCGHVQLKETVSPHLLFNEYSYASSDSPALVAHFKQYASDVIKKYSLVNDYTHILEFGMNDGILLREFENLGIINLFGVEPAANICEIARTRTKAKIINDFFDWQSASYIKLGNGTMDIICANNTFAHINDIDSVMEGVMNILAENGIFIFENAYLLDMVNNLYFDQIYHEHLQYFSIKPLIPYLKGFGLEIFDIEHNNIQGGTIRVFCKRITNTKFSISPNVKYFVQQEEESKLFNDLTWNIFATKISLLQAELTKELLEIQSSGKTICCYGCPAKFTLFSKFFRLDSNLIKYVVDDSPLKQGKFSPEKKIPIVSNQHFRDNPTDYCLISAWNMAEPIMKKLDYYKGKFIIPMPKLKII